MRTDLTTKLLLGVIAIALSVIAINMTFQPIVARAKVNDGMDKIGDALYSISREGLKIEVSQKWGDTWKTQEQK